MLFILRGRNSATLEVAKSGIRKPDQLTTIALKRTAKSLALQTVFNDALHKRPVADDFSAFWIGHGARNDLTTRATCENDTFQLAGCDRIAFCCEGRLHVGSSGAANSKSGNKGCSCHRQTNR